MKAGAGVHSSLHVSLEQKLVGTKPEFSIEMSKKCYSSNVQGNTRYHKSLKDFVRRIEFTNFQCLKNNQIERN